jgi:hypothetical protein
VTLGPGPGTPGTGAAARGGGGPARGVLAAALISFVLAAAVRAPSLSLPIEGDAVAYGALARSLASGEGFTIDGAAHDRYPPLWPAAVSVVVAAGVPVTTAERALALVLGSLAAALAAVAAGRLARGAASPLLAGALVAVHPSLALFAGGLVPGSEALAIVLVLLFAVLSASPSRGARAAGALCAALLPLARLDAIPFALAAAALLWTRGRGTGAGLGRLVPPLLVLLPAAAWVARAVVLSGSLLGAGYAAHAPSLARVPKNLLVLGGLVLPAAGLVVLWPFVPRGVRALREAGGDAWTASRAVLLAAAAQVALLAVFAGPTAAGDGALSFSSGALRFAAVAVPLVAIAAVAGLAGAGEALARRAAGAALLGATLASVFLVAPEAQRRLPIPPLAASRLADLRDAFRAAVALSQPGDWIAVRLAPRTNQGVEVFLADAGAPGRRVGVLSERAPPRGLFPRAAVLPLARELPTERRVWLLTDEEVPEGPIYTAGGQGIFHRIRYEQWPAEPAPARFTIHQVRRPPR